MDDGRSCVKVNILIKWCNTMAFNSKEVESKMTEIENKISFHTSKINELRDILVKLNSIIDINDFERNDDGSIKFDQNGQQIHHLQLAEEVSFFNKASLLNTLDSIPNNSKVIIDCTNSKSIAYDVIELILNYESNAKTKNFSKF